MEIHHGKHHAGYVKKLNQACLEEGIDCNCIEKIFERISELPLSIRNNAGGHYNHTLLWSILDDSITKPSSELHADIEKRFGGLEGFKINFSKACLDVFGSGWAWLIVDSRGELKIVTTQNQDNPLMNDLNLGYPILGVDVWEHAYYLKYQNNRIDYVHALWSLINWDVVSERYINKPEMNDFST